MNDSWLAEARCRNTEPAIFFPTSQADNRFDEAKKLCQLCTVKEACLALVIELPEYDDRWGVFGGLDPNDRYRLRRRKERRRV